MSNINVQRLSVKPTAVLDATFPPFPEPPPELMRLPGMAKWAADLKLWRERSEETIRRLVLTKPE